VPPHWSVNIRVEDADATAEQAASLGGHVIAPVLDPPGFRSAVLADPQGAVYSIGQLTSGS
jgi:predicted enzyme related to lactoylglutathione lyase